MRSFSRIETEATWRVLQYECLFVRFRVLLLSLSQWVHLSMTCDAATAAATNNTATRTTITKTTSKNCLSTSSLSALASPSSSCYSVSSDLCLLLVAAATTMVLDACIYICK